jgi:Iap family predicted aminopeptidase
MAMTKKEEFARCIDTSYSYHLAKKMEKNKSNKVLGYRTAGSLAEFQTGELLVREMKALGLSEVTKNEIILDSWEFRQAKMKLETSENITYQFELGGYQTQFETNGYESFEVVYLKKGTAADYKRVDVRGKLVLVDINQRDEWWINYPVYQAYLKGAAALIAVQEGGYGEISEKALNAQDIAGPSYAPAFSMSRSDADILKQELQLSKSVVVEFSASSNVKERQPSYNIVGKLKGKAKDSMLLVTAHYDSYFDGFQDDNAAIGMMLGIAKALLDSNYQPEKTIVFCAMAAEEWGITNSKFDWSTGAFQQIFYVHPEWRGKIVANINFELPAMAHGTWDKICCVYEYKDFLRAKVKKIEIPKDIYPDGLEVVAPVKTWSDDFSLAIAGVPSMVNDFSDSKFMETHYHSQYDNEIYYQEKVYYFHHELYGKLLIDFDHTILPPLNFATLFAKMVIPDKKAHHIGAAKEIHRLNRRLLQAKESSHKLYKKICKVNALYETILEQGGTLSETEQIDYQEISENLLQMFQMEQDAFVRLNWHDEVKFSHEIIMQNLKYVSIAIEKLKTKDCKGAMNAIYHIDNNRYAFLFEQEVYEYFSSYVLEQPADRLQWGAGRIIGHENLFDLVMELKKKSIKQHASYRKEIELLMAVKQRQIILLKNVIDTETDVVKRITIKGRKA